jgi:hypothetical protein
MSLELGRKEAHGVLKGVGAEASSVLAGDWSDRSHLSYRSPRTKLPERTPPHGPRTRRTSRDECGNRR